MKKWENLKLYIEGKKVAIPENFNGDNYLFTLLARFNCVADAEMFAKMKSKKSRPYEMFSVTKNLSGDPLGEYYVYTVLDTTY